MADIFELITNEDLDGLKKLLQSNPSIANTMNEQGFTPLISAVEGGNIEIIKLLLEQGANPNQEDEETGSTPLIAAIENNNIEIINLLLKHGANLKNQDGKMLTPLIVAIEEGNIEIIKLLLEKGANPNEADQQGFTPLLIAIENDNIEIMGLLLRFGADPNKTTNQGYTLIAFAASQYETNPKAMEFLLERLDDGQLREEYSDAIINSHTNSDININFVLLLSTKDPKLEHLDAALFGLGEAEDLFSPDLSKPKFLLLKAAVENGNLQLVRLLIKHGADISSHKNHQELLTIAKGKEANDNINDVTKIQELLQKKTSAFLIMIEDGDIRLIKMKIENGDFAFYTTKNSEDDFIFCEIIDQKDPQRLEMLKTLIEANFNLWKRNIQGLAKYIEDKKDNDYEEIKEIVKELQNKNKEGSLQYLDELLGKATRPQTTAGSPSLQQGTQASSK